jgi:hypothetical protein
VRGRDFSVRKRDKWRGRFIERGREKWGEIKGRRESGREKGRWTSEK